ncbi:amidohydrolase family protein [Rhizobium leguminosarum]|uniref:amidohydrolase family protein n=1 Tax=Rhizobium leguminosarum TaxID=384 RepID=UPI0003735F6C|nr:amidohydrolase family protein [Rhizobium leguminosarum]NKK56246.1 amidohydrolase family protein [Rhizobium leguminosarum bv. viciae]NKL55002.1 amidohydrolase family protein [Rhizobium leguminosarum bv. viciae]
MIVDAHNHVIPESMIAFLEKDADTFGVKTDTLGGVQRLVHREGFAYPMCGEFLYPAEKVRKLDERGFDKAVISPSPTLFFYRVPAERNVEFVRLLNEEIVRFVRSAPDRLIGMGTLPMQSPEASIAEIDYLVDHLGIRSVMIGTHIDGVQLADPSLRPVLKHAADRGVFILTHPYYFGSKPGLEPYYLTNLIGNPLDTTVMAAHLIFGGVMEEIPNLKICLSHGGGFAPYQVGRLVHGWNVRKEAKTVNTSPKELLKRFYFDTITHDPEALRYLIDFAGADHALLGTDIPFDMADLDPLGTLALADVSLEDRTRIIGGNALDLCATVNTRSLENVR